MNSGLQPLSGLDDVKDVYKILYKRLLLKFLKCAIISSSPLYHVTITNNSWFMKTWIAIQQEYQKMNTASTWVQERRLRPIYELLDGGNNRKVITEVDRLLKKQPAFPCAMVLKALALIRMSKPDEARLLLLPVAQKIPTDDATIQAMSICYRELEAPELLAGLLEAACEKEKSEELLTHCFMAHVRIQDYKKMYISALQLYKLYNKVTYYGWTVASMFLKFEGIIGPMEQADVVSVEVAVRMMEKYIVDQKIPPMEDNMLGLYLRILVRQANWRKIIDVLTSSGYPQQNWCNDDLHTYYCLALERLQLHDELFEYLKSAYLKNKEDYGLLRQIIDIFGIYKIDEDKLGRFLDELVENSRNRTVLLADLYYSLHCLENPCRNERITRDLFLVVEYAVDKPSFFSDVLDYFRVVSRGVQFKFVQSIAPGVDMGGPNYDTIAKVVRDANFELIFRSYIWQANDDLSRIRQANVCFGKYLVCDGLMDSLHSNDHLRTKESDYHDHFLIIAARNLMDDFYRSNLHKTKDLDSYLSSETWTALAVENVPPELVSLTKMLRESQRKEENSSAIDGLTETLDELQLTELCQAHFADKESLLVVAICLLEYGLMRSPYNYVMRTLLSKVYARFGAVSQAIKVIQGLHMKHVQWDSIGYLIIPLAISSGTYSEAMKMLTSAETMYTSYKRESMEHVIAAYKYGSFHKIQDFLNFRHQLLSSVQCGITVVEKRLLEFMVTVSTSQDVYKIAEIFDREMVDWVSSQKFGADNRDFSVIEYFDSYINLSYVRDISADFDLYTHRVRMSILYILKSFIVYPNATLSDELNILNNLIDKFECYHGVWTDFFQLHIANMKEVANPQLHGIWPNRLTRYYQLRTSAYLLTQFKHLRDIIMEKENPQLGRFQILIEDASEKMLDILRENQKAFENDTRMINMDRFIHDFHIVLETFSFSRILLEVAVSLTKRHQEFCKGKGRAKERTSNVQLYKKAAGIAVRSILEKYKALQECFTIFLDTLKDRPIPRFDHMKTSTKDVWNKSFFSAAIPLTYDVAQRNIRESQITQLEEMRKISAGLMEYIRINLEPYGK